MRIESRRRLVHTFPCTPLLTGLGASLVLVARSLHHLPLTGETDGTLSRRDGELSAKRLAGAARSFARGQSKRSAGICPLSLPLCLWVGTILGRAGPVAV